MDSSLVRDLFNIEITAALRERMREQLSPVELPILVHAQMKDVDELFMGIYVYI